MPKEQSPLEGEIVPGEFPGAAQDFSLVKQSFLTALVAFSSDMLSLVRRADELSAFYFANGFNTGGANQFVQNDVPVNQAWLTPTIITNAVAQVQLESNCATGASTFAAGTIAAGGRDVMRQCSGKPNTAG